MHQTFIPTRIQDLGSEHIIVVEIKVEMAVSMLLKLKSKRSGWGGVARHM